MRDKQPIPHSVHAGTSKRKQQRRHKRARRLWNRFLAAMSRWGMAT